MSNGWNQGNKLMVSNLNPISPIKLSELNIPEKVLKNFNVSSDLILMGVSEKSHLIQRILFFLLFQELKPMEQILLLKLLHEGLSLWLAIDKDKE